MSCPCSNWDICIDQGATWSRELTFFDSAGAPVDVSTWAFTGQIRAYYDSPVVLATFAFAPGLTTNAVLISLTAVQTAALPVPPSQKSPVRKKAVYIYDVLADTGTEIDRVFQGSATISAEVTK